MHCTVMCVVCACLPVCIVACFIGFWGGGSASLHDCFFFALFGKVLPLAIKRFMKSCVHSAVVGDKKWGFPRDFPGIF